MTNETILKKAIEKALSNGWDMFGMIDKQLDEWWIVDDVLCIRYYAESFLEHYSVSDIVFNHDFAKAFFGEGKVIIKFIDTWEKDAEGSHRLHARVDGEQEAWRCHLQRMVLQENPLSYLEKFL